MSGKSSSVLKVGDEVAAAVKIRDALREHADDPAMILDMIEGSTNLHEAIAAIDAEICEDEALILGLDAMIERLQARKGRLERTNEMRRNIILAAMDKAQVPISKAPTGTITAKATAPKLEIADESLIPAEFWRKQDPVLDKKALNAAAKDGKQIPGTRLTNGGIQLQIRRV